MPVLNNPKTQKTELDVTFSAPELSQLEAFANLYGESVAAFVQRAALEAANITSIERSSKGRRSGVPDVLWLTDNFSDAPEAKEANAPVSSAPAPLSGTPVAPTPEIKPKRGIVGEQSRLAHGHGLVWDIRQALGRERVHGLGWTREQLAFVLKLSVVGVRKMEHQGTSPVKSLESRKALLNLAKTLENPALEISGYIEREEAALR